MLGLCSCCCGGGGAFYLLTPLLPSAALSGQWGCVAGPDSQLLTQPAMHGLGHIGKGRMCQPLHFTNEVNIMVKPNVLNSTDLTLKFSCERPGRLQRGRGSLAGPSLKHAFLNWGLEWKRAAVEKQTVAENTLHLSDKGQKGLDCCWVVQSYVLWWKYILHFLWKSRSQSLEEERRGTESRLLEVQCKVSTVSDGLGCHVVCWCWSTVFSEVWGQCSRLPGSVRALHASCCWPTLWRPKFHFPTGLGTCT